MAKTTIDSAAIRELAKILEETGLSEVELKEGDRSIRVVRHAPSYVVAPPPPPVAPAAPVTAGADETEEGAITSPMVGTIYLASGPGEPPFVSVGSTVAEGDTLFIVEAMKVMNPILADRAGTVKRILARDARPVEFGETLLILE